MVVVLGLLTAALVPYVNNLRAEREAEGTPLADLGVARGEADCDPVATKDATGSGDHLNPPQSIPYEQSPPSSGAHWPNFLQGSEIRRFYTAEDRPEVERLVHSLEHGHTILWYDETVKPGSQAYRDVQAIAAKYEEGDYFIAAPWMESDGEPFPSGKHVALTHWTGPQEQQGVTQYCGAPSGAVVESFVEEYPANNAPEPGAP